MSKIPTKQTLLFHGLKSIDILTVLVPITIVLPPHPRRGAADVYSVILLARASCSIILRVFPQTPAKFWCVHRKVVCRQSVE